MDAKQLAARRGQTLTALVEEALRERILRARDPELRRRFEVPVSTAGGGPMPGVDLDENAAVRDLMDEGLPLDRLR
ncbi:MAG: hypothetical protein LC808_29140 [Actinobacteria bacterium]|nr:hypothetical protein [Actinomycetota bacterium]